MPFFSIITPTCNRPDTLARAISSVLTQTFNDFEYIIVNNGGNELNLPFADHRIRVVCENRKGANYARNAGIENAQAEFICFLDDDDEYLENHLQSLFDLIKKNNDRIGLYRTYTKIESRNKEIKDQPVVLLKQGQSQLDHIYSVLLFMACVCCHRNILREMQFDPSIPVAQDYHLWSRILVKYPLIETPVITTIYHQTATSISSPSKRKYFHYIEVYSALFEYPEIKSQLSKSIKRDRIFKYYFWLLCEFKNELKFGEYVRVLCKIVQYKPAMLMASEFYSRMLRTP